MPSVPTLTGKVVRLVPLSVEHAAPLLACTPRETFTYFTSAPRSWDADGFGGFIEQLLGAPDRMHFAVLDLMDGAVIGSTAFLDMRLSHKGLEIGFTWYTPRVRGTRVNPECKLLLMQHAFEVMGMERVQLKCDARNEHSRRAIVKLGATFEGIWRQNMVLPDGTMRDTAMFSVIRSEWASVREALSARIGA